MQLTASAPMTTPVAAPAAQPTWPNVGVIRRGGPDAPAAANVVAQVNLTFPGNFGAQGLIDVSAGAALATFSTLDDAIDGARPLAAGRASLGVVRQVDGSFTVNELTVPDVISIQADWDQVKDVTLVVGHDPVIPRTIDDIRQLVDMPDHGQLMSIWTRGGNTRYDAHDGRFTGAFNHM